MPPERFVVAAEHGGQTVDLWKLVRSADRFLSWSCEFPAYHRTWIDGQRPHATAQDGLESAPIHPDLAAAIQAHEPDRKAKHHPQGQLTRWLDIEDFMQTTGLGFTYPDDFFRFPTASTRSHWKRLVVPLEIGQGVQIEHYLAWPTKHTRQFLSSLSTIPGTFDVWIVDRWEPWSIVHLKVTEPRAEQWTPGPRRPED